LCEIIREESYEEALRNLPNTFHRLEELDEAIDWGLARGPEMFDQIEDDYYTWKTEKMVNFPAVRIFFTFDSEFHIVHLVDIQVITENQ